MWWQALIPVVLDIVKKILDNRLPKAMAGAKAEAAFCPPDECDRLADRLQECLDQAPKGASPATHEGGIVQHITDLVAALRAKDWAKVQTLVLDLIAHL